MRLPPTYELTSSSFARPGTDRAIASRAVFYKRGAHGQLSELASMRAPITDIAAAVGSACRMRVNFGPRRRFCQLLEEDGVVDNSRDDGEADANRRSLLMGAGAFAAAGLAASTRAQVPANPPSSGPIRAGRDTILTGKVAFVTGAARGIGRAIAVELAANGADVAVFDICGFVSTASNAKPATSADLADTERHIKALGRRCISIRGDIRKIAELRAAHDRVLRELGRIDIVVADAAIQRWKDLLTMEDADWVDVIDNNVNGTANTVRAFAKTLTDQRSGRFILISSMQGKHGTAGASSYSASKHAIIGLMKSAAEEFGKYGVTVNCILPGLVDTALTRYPERWSHVIGETTDNPPKNPGEAEAWNNRAPRVPLKVAWLKAEDISPMAVFLASDASAMCTGANYEVTAGDSAQDV
jgi:NAD(P)-dependent dehydrogenase (short-subunit alcohol dehydrogenase family)